MTVGGAFVYICENLVEVALTILINGCIFNVVVCLAIIFISATRIYSLVLF